MKIWTNDRMIRLDAALIEEIRILAERENTEIADFAIILIHEAIKHREEL